MTPFLSIIIPVYNVQKCLKRCVDSILNQSYSDFELILVDNNSKDDSLKICKEYEEKDSRVRVLQQNVQGASAARNMGIENAQGKYILFVDSDDYVKENYLSSIVAVKNHYPDHANIWFGFCTTMDNGEPNYSVVQRDESKPLHKVVNRNIYMLLYENWLAQNLWNKIFDREVIIKNNIRMEEWLTVGEDDVFIMKYIDCTGQSEIVFSNEIIYVYVCDRKDSLTHRYYKNREQITKAINDNLIKYTTKWNLPAAEMKKAYNSAFYRLENTMRAKVKNDTSANFFEKIKYCNRILRSDDFKFYMKNCNCHINLTQRVSYKLGFYPLAMLYDYLYDVKCKFKKRR